jgi:S-adenosylmethionine hydrolase
MKMINRSLPMALLCIAASHCAHKPKALPGLADATYLTANVVRISEEFANINTDLSGAKLSQYDITPQKAFTFRYKDQTIPALLGKDYSDVAKGDWVGLIEEDGNLQLAISFGNAATKLGCVVGDTLYIKPLSVEE